MSIRTSLLAALFSLALPLCALGVPAIDAPNAVVVSDRIVTSGQPSADALGRLAAEGFGAVIYLAPPTVPNAVAGEDRIVRDQGLAFVNIPIDFGKPGSDDVGAFIEAMNRFGDRKVLVHCEANMRASSMTFLYRVIALHENPEQAYAAVTAVWSPRGVWKRLIEAQLTAAHVAFELY